MCKFLVITKGFRELSSPNSICLNDVLKIWYKKGINVDIISSETRVGGDDDSHFYVSTRVQKDKYRKIKKIFTYPIDDEKLVKVIADKIEERIEKETYDLIIAIVNPPEAANALKIIKDKYPKQKCCLYEIDALSNRYKFPKTLSEKIASYLAVKWAQSIYEKMDIVIHMKSHKMHFEKKSFIRFKDKSHYLDIPAFKIHSWNTETNPDVISLLYAGAFYKDLRNPERMIDVLKQLTLVKNIEIHMYINDVMYSEVETLCENNDAFTVSKYIPEEQINALIKSASCLLSLGNKDSDFLPSKVLSYMGTGKPIIHFYYDKYDVALSYLEKYHNVLCLDVNNHTETNLNLIIDFIENKMNSTVMNEAELLACFCENTPEYSALKIMELAGVEIKN